VDLEHERRLAELLRAAVAGGVVSSAHDVSDGGLAVALAECTFTGPERIGAHIALADSIRPDALLFGESTGRVITTSSAPDALLGLAAEHGVPARAVGETGGDRLVVGAAGGAAWFDLAVADLHEGWARAIPRRLST
jgi:phosphoribosylformylglycinamidine synthase